MATIEATGTAAAPIPCTEDSRLRLLRVEVPESGPAEIVMRLDRLSRRYDPATGGHTGPVVSPPWWMDGEERRCSPEDIGGWEDGHPYRVLLALARPLIDAERDRQRRERDAREEARLRSLEADSPLVPGVYSTTGGATWTATATYAATGREVRDLRRTDPSDGMDHPHAHLALREATARCRATGRPVVEVEAPTPAEVHDLRLRESLSAVGAIPRPE